MTALSAAPSYRGRPFSVHSLYNVFGCKGTEFLTVTCGKSPQNKMHPTKIECKITAFF